MSKRQTKFFTPPAMTVTQAPEAIRLAREKPHKMRSRNRLSTPNVAVMMNSPNISPIAVSSMRSLQFDSPSGLKLSFGNKGEKERPLDNSFNNSTYVSPLEKSFRAPLNDHLDLKVMLKEFELSHLTGLFEAKGINLSQLSEMVEQDFINLGVFKLNELHKLKRIINLLNDAQNTSY